MCIYGELGVSIQSDNCFEGGFTTCGSSEYPTDGQVQVKKSEYGDWDEQGGSNAGFEYAKQPDGYISPQIASQIGDFIQVIDDGFTTGTWSGQEGFDYSFADPGIGPSIVGSLPDPLVSGSYEVLGTADIPEGDYTGVPLAIKADIIKVSSNTTLDHVILMAETEIDIGSGFNITNSVFASNDLLKFGSNGNLGGTDCDPNGVNFAAYSQGKLTIQSNTNFRNAHLITNYDVDVFDLQSNNIYQGVTIQAIGDIFLGSNNQFSGCPQTGDGEITGTVAGLYLRLVD